jgi:hypothetical protein
MVVIRPKNIVKDDFQVVAYVRPNMHINTPRLAQQFPHQDQPLIHHVEIGVRPLAPHVPVGHHLQGGLVLADGLGLVADGNIHREIGPPSKGGSM